MAPICEDTHMADYRKRVTITAAERLELDGLRFQPGQKVDVWVRSEEDRAARSRELATLLAETQPLPEAQAVSEDDILREIAAHRDGR